MLNSISWLNLSFVSKKLCTGSELIHFDQISNVIIRVIIFLDTNIVKYEYVDCFEDNIHTGLFGGLLGFLHDLVGTKREHVLKNRSTFDENMSTKFCLNFCLQHHQGKFMLTVSGL